MVFTIFFNIDSHIISLQYDTEYVDLRRVIYDAFEKYLKKNRNTFTFSGPLTDKYNFLKCGFFRVLSKTYNYNEANFVLDYDKYNETTIWWITKFCANRYLFSEEDISDIRKYYGYSYYKK